MRFYKYHALGNDYLVLDKNEVSQKPTPRIIRIACHRHYGIGSDGILFGPLKSRGNIPLLKIFNPDGSEAEKSGNGLRIFARYLYDGGMVSAGEWFPVMTAGGRVACLISKDAKNITVEMGCPVFKATDIPAKTRKSEFCGETLQASSNAFTCYAASIGNPHCVVPVEKVMEEQAREYGPHLESHECFPAKTNVQFMEIIDDRNIKIEIWERGAGYTLASGSSSCAAAAVARKMGYCGDEITVHMPGGKLEIRFDETGTAFMKGPATRIGSCELNEEALRQKV